MIKFNNYAFFLKCKIENFIKEIESLAKENIKNQTEILELKIH